MEVSPRGKRARCATVPGDERAGQSAGATDGWGQGVPAASNAPGRVAPGGGSPPTAGFRWLETPRPV